MTQGIKLSNLYLRDGEGNLVPLNEAYIGDMLNKNVADEQLGNFFNTLNEAIKNNDFEKLELVKVKDDNDNSYIKLAYKDENGSLTINDEKYIDLGQGVLEDDYSLDLEINSETGNRKIILLRNNNEDSSVTIEKTGTSFKGEDYFGFFEDGVVAGSSGSNTNYEINPDGALVIKSTGLDLISFGSNVATDSSDSFKLLYNGSEASQNSIIKDITVDSYGRVTAIKKDLNKSSLAVGNNATASGKYSTALGTDTNAAGENSVALNLGTIANGANQTVLGKYNKSDSNQYAVIVGNGTNANNRNNILGIHWDNGVDIWTKESAGYGIKLISSNATRGITSTQDSFQAYDFLDINKKRLATIQHGMRTNGESQLNLYVLGNNTGENVYGGIQIFSPLGTNGWKRLRFNINDGVLSGFTADAGVLTGKLSITHGGTNATSVAGARTNLSVPAVAKQGNFWGLLPPSGADETSNYNGWIRTPQSGLIPYKTGGASAIGTPSWPFNEGHFKNLNVTTSLKIGSTDVLSKLNTLSSQVSGILNWNFVYLFKTFTAQRIVTLTKDWAANTSHEIDVPITVTGAEGRKFKPISVVQIQASLDDILIKSFDLNGLDPYNTNIALKLETFWYTTKKITKGTKITVDVQVMGAWSKI